MLSALEKFEEIGDGCRLEEDVAEGDGLGVRVGRDEDGGTLEGEKVSECSTRRGVVEERTLLPITPPSLPIRRSTLRFAE